MNDFLKKFLKFILKTLAVLAIIILVLTFIFAIALQFFDANKYKQVIERTFKQETGQSLFLNGPIKIALLPNPRAKLNNAVMNLTFKGNNVQIIAKEFDFDLGWSFLFSDNVNIRSINGKFLTMQFSGKEAQTPPFTIDSFSGSLKSSCCDIDIPHFNIKIGKEVIEGNLNIGLLTNIPKINGKLSATQWSLPLYRSNDVAKEKPLSNKTFPLEWLSNVEGQLDFHVDNLLLNDKPVENVDINFNLKNKTLIITPKAKIDGGKVNGKVIFKQNTDSTVNVDVSLKVTNTNAKKFLQKFNNKKFDLQKFLIEDGVLDFTYIGNGNGKNIETMLSNVSGKTAVNIKNIKANYLKSVFNGNLNVESNGKLTNISGKFTAKKVTIPSSQENWNFDWIKNTQGQIELHIDDFSIDQIHAQNANVTLKIKNNELTIIPQAVLAGGKLAGQFFIQPKGNTYFMKTGFSLQGANAGEFLKFITPSAPLHNGNVDVNFNGDGEGKNLHSLISSLSGRGLINIQELSIEGIQVDSRYVDLFSALWKAFTPTQAGTILQCAVLRFDIANGHANLNQSIGLETSDLSILGGGDFDLATKAMNFTFDMMPRSHLNIEVGSFNNIVYVKGTLDQPQISASMQGVIKKGGSLALGFATGGISFLVEKLAKIAVQNKSVCQQVLSGG